MYVVKTFSRNHQRRYTNEWIALTAIKDLKHQHIIKYYGSFVQGNTYSLVLEFVDGVNLAEYFEQTTKPATRLDAWLFWKSLSGVWSGLAGLHGLVRSDDASNKASEIVMR